MLQVVPTTGQFPDTSLGTYSTLGAPSGIYLLNNTATTDTIDLNQVTFSGPGADDYLITAGQCGPSGASVIVLTQGLFCYPDISFFPGALGDRSATMTIQGSADTSPIDVSLRGTGTTGYYQVDAQGHVATAGDATFHGDLGTTHLNKPVVGMATTGDDGGYWLVASDGGIFSYGSAQFYGSAGGIRLNEPIVGMTASPDAGGYWFVASDGGVFSYGDAQFHGSTGSLHLNKPIVGMAATPDGAGYWLVASDGGVFSFGDARFHGSTGSLRLNKPIVGMAATPDGQGYWLVASDGGVFSFGDAQFHGSTGSLHLNKPIVGMAAMATGGGYWFSAADGGLFAFGDAPFLGSGVGSGIGQVVDMAATSGPTLQAVDGIPAIRHAHLAVPAKGLSSGRLPRITEPK